MEQKCANCWSPSETKMKSLIERKKGVFFSPLLHLLIKLKISANMVSYFSAIIGLVSTVYLFFDIKISAILLIISFIIDGIDGSLARITKTDNIQGSITDCLCDQVVISSSTIGLMSIGILNPIIGGLYLVTYPLVITFAILRNLINQPRFYVFRPRIIGYLVFIVYAFTKIDIINLVTLILSLTLIFQVITDFYFLRKYLHD